jgi:hypothetical protein
LGTITSPTSTPYSFTEVGAGYIGAQGSGAAGSNTYTMSAEYVLSPTLIGSGKELLFGSAATGQNGTSQTGTGFDSLTLSITDKTSSGTYALSKTFGTYSAFSNFVAAGVDLDPNASGTQDVTVAMTEALSGLNGASALYVLAITPLGNGPFTSQVAVLATPIPAALPLFASGLLGLGALGWKRRNPRA